MLAELYINNIAVIQEASIRLGQGLNAFTGETGAGKTMLISAINMVLGERTPRDIIRTGEDKAGVSAVFEDISPAARAALAEMGMQDEDGTVLISREITAAGKNSCKINGVPATVAMLRRMGDTLIQLHGQRDSQQLLDEQSHLHLLDTFAQNEAPLAEYRELYAGMQAVRSQLQKLQMDENQKAQRMDMLRFQIDEIEAAGLEDVREEEELLSRRKIIQGSERILEELSAAYALLSGDDGEPGMDGALEELGAHIGGVARFMDEFTPYAARLDEITYDLADLAADVRRALDTFDYDPRELDALEARLDVIYRLKRKYGGSIEEILEFYSRAADELNALCGAEEQTARLGAELGRLEAKAAAAAQRLSDRRLAAAKDMVRRVEEELSFLDMPGVRLSFAHAARSLSPSGVDEMQLMISANVGEPPKPLSRVASGGELSRIMLAVKNVLAGQEASVTLVFDEIDAGISGRAAGKVGAKLAQVAGRHQVICVTHLAPVAAFADTHLQIAKLVRDGRTFTQVTVLDDAGAVAELARITSGDLVTPAALSGAGELRRMSREQSAAFRAALQCK